jgi:putative DNA methylase
MTPDPAATAPAPVVAPKKLIEVALPLDAINAACAREKSIRHGHPSTLHLWWARRPLAAARAVIFSQMVNDPEDIWRLKNPGREPNKQEKGHWTRARQKLFEIIEDLVKWENTTNEEVLERAREEIRKSWRETCDLNKDHPQAAELFDPEKLPAFHDPFAGGGAIPLEAQRLGLESYASDLNPVAVLINKAMIEIPPKFAGREPVNPEWQSKSPEEKAMKVWKGAQGLAEDVRYYGKWMRDEAEKRIGHLYPKVEITADMAKDRPDLKPLVGKKLTVIAWIWARTVKSPNPGYSHVDVPLASTFVLCSKERKEVWLEPELLDDGYRLRVRLGTPPAEAHRGMKAARGANFRCIMSGFAIEPDYIKAEGNAGRIGATLLAVFAENEDGRHFLEARNADTAVATAASPGESLANVQIPIANDPRPMTCLLYGMHRFDQLFTSRQLVAMTTMCELVGTARRHIAKLSPMSADDQKASPRSQAGLSDYANALSIYLAICVSRAADYWGTGAIWETGGTFVAHVFTRNALPITWDYPEANPFGMSGGSWSQTCVEWVHRYLKTVGPSRQGYAIQHDAQTQALSAGRVVSTDPPYFDNIGYADLADYFYIWLRQSLQEVFPDLFATRITPKAEELVATAFRHGGRGGAERFFLNGMMQAMGQIAAQSSPTFPVSIYYAFKQSDTDSPGETSSRGWDTFLEAVIKSGFSIGGTWPMRTERPGRMRETGSNALASSIVLVCRKRSATAETISRRQFIRELNATLPQALDAMTRQSEGEHSPVAPVDLSQAIIGPGMAVFSKYAAVLEADGSPMTVRTALQLINRFLAEDDFDADTQFCLHWFEQHGWDSGKFGEADTLARAKGTSVDGVKTSGVLQSAGGNVRLLKWADYKPDWDPTADDRLPVWEGLHQLVRVFKTDGESAAGKVLAAVAAKAEPIRQLAYRLYTLCERAGRAEDARAYNELITSWSPIESAAAPSTAPAQKSLFE